MVSSCSKGTRTGGSTSLSLSMVVIQGRARGGGERVVLRGELIRVPQKGGQTFGWLVGATIT